METILLFIVIGLLIIGLIGKSAHIDPLYTF